MQVIIDKWGTPNDATTTALEDQLNEAEQCICVAGKDMDGIHVRGTCWSKGSATRSYIIAENHKDVVGCVCHERGAPGYDLAMNMTAYQGTREICLLRRSQPCSVILLFYLNLCFSSFVLVLSSVDHFCLL